MCDRKERSISHRNSVISFIGSFRLEGVCVCCHMSLGTRVGIPVIAIFIRDLEGTEGWNCIGALLFAFELYPTLIPCKCVENDDML